MNNIEVAADAVIQFLYNMGIKKFHNYPGGTIAPLLDACHKFNIEVVTSRNEQGAGYAALAQAKLTKLPGIVAVTSGPGVTNVLTPVADAYFDSIPMLVFTGQVGTADLRGDTGVRQRGFQEVDTPLLMRAITKAQYQPKTVEELIEIIPLAWNQAQEGRKGPISIDLPMNVQRAPCLQSLVATPIVTIKTLPEEITRFVDIISAVILKSQKPLIICGNGMLELKLVNYLKALLEIWPAVVSHSLLGIGCVPSDSELNLGFHGHTGSQLAGKAISQADMVLVLGSRLDVRQTGSVTNKFAPNAKILRVDFDKHELENSRVESEETLNASLDQFMPYFYEIIKNNSNIIPKLDDWHKEIRQLRNNIPWNYPEFAGLSPMKIIETLSDVFSSQVVCVTGVGAHQHWVARHFRFDYPTRRLFTSAGHGAMGYDLPTAIGVAIHEPDTEVLCIVGDGSFQMNIQELDMISEHDLNVKIVVLDNHRLGLVSQFQLMNWSSDTACGNKHSPDFCAIANGYGIEARRVVTKAELDSAVEEMKLSKKAFLLHVEIDSRHDIVPMLLGGQTMDKMWPDFDMHGNPRESV